MCSQEALVTPSVLRWARQKARLSAEEAASRIGRSAEDIEAWERGEKRPSMAQARRASEAYKRSLAVFYLPEPPEEFDTLKDFRQIPNTEAIDYSPELALIIRHIQSRQEWMHQYCIRHQAAPLSFVGSATTADSPTDLARTIRSFLEVTTHEQIRNTAPATAFNYWTGKIEAIGVCVCREGKIEIEEARGIALADPYAPFIYVNSNDSYAGRQFTLLHELVHLWINASGLSNLGRLQKSPHSPHAVTEVFCNRTAALILLPPRDFADAWMERDDNEVLEAQIDVVARKFKVSDETVARRLLDNDMISQGEYERLRAQYQERWREQAGQRSGGGDYYRNAVSFNGRLFTHTVLHARYSGEITIREASIALGVKTNHLKRLAQITGLLQSHQGGVGQ